VTDSVSVDPLLAAAVVPENGWRKSHETGASINETSSDSINGAKTLLVGVGGTSDTDDIEERDVAGEADLEELLDLPRATSTEGSSVSSSKSPLLPSSESSSESSTAPIGESAFSKWTAFCPSQGA